jgi:glucosamine--fructose-6-phosphate aminotransferase (isomerizing)
MCGIVGYIGQNQQVTKSILTGLKALEYRGYDSAGIATLKEDTYQLTKSIGKIKNLESKLQNINEDHNIGIGHTRWATHGKPNLNNCHPHLSYDERFIIVHNGIIDNYVNLKEVFLDDSEVYGDTDSEIIAHLLSVIASKNPMKTTLDIIYELVNLIEGSYAFGIIDRFNPETLYALKNKSPLLVGIGDNFNMIGSDMMAMIHATDEYFELDDLEVVMLTKDNVRIYNGVTKKRIKKSLKISNLAKSILSLGDFDHYMLKEIYDQPSVIKTIIDKYSDPKLNLINEDFKTIMNTVENIYIIAAGTSYNAGLASKEILEKGLNKPVNVIIASEFIHNQPIIGNNPLFIYLSQSGETADSRACLKITNALGFYSLAITNVQDSTLSREATHSLHIYAGVEIAVASTKAYVAQIATVAMIVNNITTNLELNLIDALNDIAADIELFLNPYTLATVQSLVNENLINHHHAFYIGRTSDYIVAIEAALKLKEVSYIHTEGFAAGELKHGTIALIEENTPVIALISHENINLPVRANIEEIKARGGNVITISTTSCYQSGDYLMIPDCNSLLAPIIMVIPTQLIAYYSALSLGLDIDQPRNLAKSVTVE